AAGKGEDDCSLILSDRLNPITLRRQMSDQIPTTTNPATEWVRIMADPAQNTFAQATGPAASP
ncbi:hypothetical protein ACFSM9_19940, partial [Microvirga arabica]|uniref:hypothetical protein n=1 Tax=Microvirga arabica TaxID=1128671 RepID=UPI00362B006E